MHVRIHLDKTGRNTSMRIDGVDVTKHVMAAGFKVEFDAARQPVVHMRIKPDALDLTGDVFAQEAAPEPTVADQVQPALRVLMDLPLTHKQEFVDRLQAEVDASLGRNTENARG